MENEASHMAGEQKTKGGGMVRWTPAAFIAVVISVVVANGWHEYLSFQALKDNYADLAAFVDARYWTAIGLFAALYILVTATSLPGATIMTLTGGLLFGTLAGTVTVVISATIGATIIFLIAKTSLGAALRNQAKGFIAKLEDGFQDNAFSYMLILRLVPLFPFVVVNIAPALIGVRLRTFAPATFIGIIPGTFAYVSAGEGLGAVIASGGEVPLSGLLTQPTVLVPIVALSVLAFVPILYKAVRGRGARGES